MKNFLPNLFVKKAQKTSFWMVFAIFQLVGMYAFGQAHSINGRVTATEDNAAIPGANIRIKGTTRGTTTNSDGKFS